MLDYLYNARWDQAIDFLLSGNPPILVRLIALNTVFLAIFAVRKAAGARHMRALPTLMVQLFVLGANLFVLYEQPVLVYLGTIIGPT